MNRTNNKALAGATLATALMWMGATASRAVPVTGLYIEDPRCDTIPTQQLTHELGEVFFFPMNEAFAVQVWPTTMYACVPDDGIQNDWVVEIRNLSGIPWQDLFFVADLGMSVGNADGIMVDLIGAPGVATDAFRIDGTVTVTGMNDNLIAESMTVNEIFEPNEVWTFLVTNFMDPQGLTPPPIFQTPGIFAGSSFATPNSTASILATPVPEPTSVAVLGLLASAALLKRRRGSTGQKQAAGLRGTSGSVTAAVVASALLTGSQSALAVPIAGLYHEDARCDTLPNQILTHELGELAFFPINERIAYTTSPASFTVCVPDDGQPNDWLVRIINLSGIAWQDLYFVVDLGLTVGNADGTMEDTAGAPGIFTDAFRIDGTVTITGGNDNLLTESINANEIFEPGEVWNFVVSNFSAVGPNGQFVPPVFVTPGVFAGSSPIAAMPGNASILANPVPEPAAAGLMCLAGMSLLRRRR